MPVQQNAFKVRTILSSDSDAFQLSTVSYPLHGARNHEDPWLGLIKSSEVQIATEVYRYINTIDVMPVATGCCPPPPSCFYIASIETCTLSID